jgi:hypothetical protein
MDTIGAIVLHLGSAIGLHVMQSWSDFSIDIRNIYIKVNINFYKVFLI